VTVIANREGVDACRHWISQARDGTGKEQQRLQNERGEERGARQGEGKAEIAKVEEHGVGVQEQGLGLGGGRGREIALPQNSRRWRGACRPRNVGCDCQ